MTNAEARFSNSLRPRKPEGSLGRVAQGGHLDFHTAPELRVMVRGYQPNSNERKPPSRWQIPSAWENALG